MKKSKDSYLWQLDQLEDKLGTKLPKDYRDHIIKYNVYTPDPDSFVLPGTNVRVEIFSFLGVTDVVNDSIYHTFEMLYPYIPAQLLPIASLTNGGFICLAMAGKDKDKIFLIDHDEQTPVTPTSRFDVMIPVADSFGEFLNFFNEEDEVNEMDENGFSALHRAAGRGDVDAIGDLLSSGVDINVPTLKEKYTPLFMAASQGHLKAVKALLKAGAEQRKVCGRSGGTAFHIACTQGHEKVVKAFIDHDKSFVELEIDGMSPLFLCTEVGHSPIANILLEHGADTEKRFKERTPLHNAIIKKDPVMVALLLRHGADKKAVFIYERKKWIPIDMAQMQRNKEIETILLSS